MNSAPSSIGLPKYQRGVGMVEVLITALVLAIGLLGLSALQLTALKNNHSSMQRSIAVVQSYTIIEAIRANPNSA
ncbi:MAG TPA: type IV pilus modification protein PilV, partial [Thiopseudomonas sp.]|nr:type IV pilus modification protein PilV [Thiopseudomonas sp.]